MNALRVVTLVFVIATAATGFAEGQGRCCNGTGQGQGKGRAEGSCLTEQASLPVEDLNEYEMESLLLMRQEEKLARDVYLTLEE